MIKQTYHFFKQTDMRIMPFFILELFSSNFHGITAYDSENL